ncbi:MAG: ATP-dependent DNA helicase RecQ [Chthoniobacterales bacterium]
MAGRLPNSVRPVDARAALEKYFGFREFLDAQESVVQAILDGKDVLTVMPTGGGKSLCFQLPAMLLEGVTIVVSPLIALMKDQVDGLADKGIPAALINSSLSLEGQREVMRGMEEGRYKLVYIAPERFRSQAFMRTLVGIKIALFAVDEAHCLSMWGHDFRPDYFRLGSVLKELGHPQAAAFTATATPVVRVDILQRLGLENPVEFVAGFARPNLRFAITHTTGESQKYERLNALIAEHKTGVIYCATRKRVEAVAEVLKEKKVKLVVYHGGLSDEARTEAQNQFVDGNADIAVATNAFGMGIDRSDIRFVAHFEIPGSVEAYYQEAGRAGRDGEPAVCELFFNFADTRVQDFFIEGSNPSKELILDLYERLRSLSDPDGVVLKSIRDIAEAVGQDVNEMSVGSALSILDRAGAIDRFDVPGQRVRGTKVLQRERSSKELKIDFEPLREKERRDREKLKSMVDLAYGRRCRQEMILEYFGDEGATRCGNCDICTDDTRAGERAPTEFEAILVQKALSGVARMSANVGGEWQARFGKGRIVQTLLGSRSREILAAGLDRLSTHGLLRSHGAAYLNELFRSLQESGLVLATGGPYPLMTLTAFGNKVMRGERGYTLRWPETMELAVGEPSGALAIPVDHDLLASLKRVRSDLAAEKNVPAYIVFGDVVLEAFSRLKPRTVEAALRIKGVGPVKAETVLPPFLEAIGTYLDEK